MRTRGTDQVQGGPLLSPGWPGPNQDFPITRVPREIVATLPLSLAQRLEFFLRVYKLELTAGRCDSDDDLELFLAFVGAIHSPRFAIFGPVSRELQTKTWLSVITAISSTCLLGRLFLVREVECQGSKPKFHAFCRIRFEKLTPDPEQLYACKGWLVTSAKRNQLWLPLRPILEMYGRDLTETLFGRCADYFAARKGAQMPCIPELCKFIAQESTPVEDLQDPVRSAGFWQAFAVHYIRSGHKRGARITTLVGCWRGGVKQVAHQVLFTPGLFAKPIGPFPSPPSHLARADVGHLRELDGITISEKLLTPIPLHVRDEDVITILYQRIQDDVTRIVHWAEASCRDLAVRIAWRRRLASEGQAITLLGNRFALPPFELKKASSSSRAATYATYGHLTKNECQDVRWLYPGGTNQEFGLPNAFDLIPHCALLIHDHPAITQSFLESLALFDPNGQRGGFVRLDSGCYLVGPKERMGKAYGQQRILLTDRGVRVVLQILHATAPYRRYLKRVGDDSWRFLFLCCVNGLSRPRRIPRLSATLWAWSDEFERTLVHTGVASTALEARGISDRFTLARLRASVGVLVFLRTHSLEEMARALGHKAYNPALLGRYIPESLLSFFRDRWVRILQTGIVLQAMGDSRLKLKAAGFRDVGELDLFLNAHCLKDLRKVQTDGAPDPAVQSYFTVSLNEEILTALLLIKQGVASGERTDVAALYWATFTARLERSIKTGPEDAFRKMLQNASCAIAATR